MKGQWKKGWQVLSILLATAGLGAAQTNTPAQAPAMPLPGAVNYVEGQASLNGQSLTRQSVGSAVLEPNQVLETGQGYAEVLLTPGTFLRVGHDSEVRMLSAGLANTKVGVVHGSAMIEAAQLVKGTELSVSMDGVTARIEQKGLYDFDANRRSVEVLDGKAKVGNDSRETTLKKGNEVLLGSAKPLKKRDFDLNTAETQPLYVWSKVRSEDEAAANVNMASNVAAYGGWYGPGWYWDPYWDSYAFMPAFGMLYSPFGWGFYSPGFAYAAPYFGYGYFGHGHFAHGTYARAFHGGGFHAGMSGVHAAGGFHGGMGGFHGGGGHGR
jgi:hypothetical protein